MKFPQIAPSILSVDFYNPQSNLEPILNLVEVFHFDVMDYQFVPNLTFGPGFIQAFRKHVPKKIFFDVHLMVKDADLMLDDFIKSGANQISIHYESINHLHRSLSYIKSKKVKAGLAINPTTGIKNIEAALPFCDHVLVMSVNPGFGGQEFIQESIQKVKDLMSWKKSHKHHFTIGMDGGVSTSNIKECAKAGVDILVTGSSLFKGKIEKNWNDLQCNLKK